MSDERTQEIIRQWNGVLKRLADPDNPTYLRAELEHAVEAAKMFMGQAERAEELLESTKAQLKRTQDARDALEAENKKIKKAFEELAFSELSSSISNVRVRQAMERLVKIMQEDWNLPGNECTPCEGDDNAER